MANEIRRIEKEFIFKNLIEKEAPVEIHIGTARLGCQLISASDAKLQFRRLTGEPAKLSEKSEAAVFFRFRGQPMTFKSRVVSTGREDVELKQPDLVYRDLGRGFERIIDPEGISVSFYVEGKNIKLDYPASETYEPVEPPSFDSGFDATRISDLLAAFRQKADEFSDENKIIMFREREPESFQEQLVARSGKILTLPFFSGELARMSPAARQRLLGQDEVLNIQKAEGKEVFTALEELKDLVKKLASRGISHELYCPILYHQYVVGYLYLMKDENDPTEFVPRTMDFVHQFSRILSYALHANGYFHPEPVVEEYSSAELIDISASGLLFSYPPDGPTINLYAELDLEIKLDNTTLPARGRVMRKFKDTDRIYFGVQFVDMENQHLEQLFDRLYGTEYRGDIDTAGLADLEDPEADRYNT